MDIISPRSPSSSTTYNYTTSPSPSSSLSEQEEIDHWIKYIHDRPFNDHRYAVDGTKLRNLGWEPQTSFEEGLRITVDWYRRFGERWWGDITNVLTPFPVTTESRDGILEEEDAKVCNEPAISRFAKEEMTVPVSKDTSSLTSSRDQQQHRQQHKYREREYRHYVRKELQDTTATNYGSSRIPRSCVLASACPRDPTTTNTGLASPGITLDEDDGLDTEDTTDDGPTVVYDNNEPHSRSSKRKLSSTAIGDDITNNSNSFKKKARGIAT